MTQQPLALTIACLLENLLGVKSSLLKTALYPEGGRGEESTLSHAGAKIQVELNATGRP